MGRNCSLFSPLTSFFFAEARWDGLSEVLSTTVISTSCFMYTRDLMIRSIYHLLSDNTIILGKEILYIKVVSANFTVLGSWLILCCPYFETKEFKLAPVSMSQYRVCFVLIFPSISNIFLWIMPTLIVTDNEDVNAIRSIFSWYCSNRARMINIAIYKRIYNEIGINHHRSICLFYLYYWSNHTCHRSIIWLTSLDHGYIECHSILSWLCLAILVCRIYLPITVNEFIEKLGSLSIKAEYRWWRWGRIYFKGVIWVHMLIFITRWCS